MPDTKPLVLAATFLAALLLLPGLPDFDRSVVANPSFEGGPALLEIAFDACGGPEPANPNRIDVDLSLVAATLQGVWIVRRTEEGTGPIAADYMMLLDLDTATGLVIEDLEPPGGTFEGFFPVYPQDAPEMAFLLCAGQGFPPTIDRFQKVSDHPREGLIALSEGTGLSVRGLSLTDAWQVLVDAGYFDRPSGSASLTGALFSSIALDSVPDGQTSFLDGRLSYAAEFRGSSTSSKPFALGQPIFGTEGGLFQGISTNDRRFIVSTGEGAFSSQPADAAQIIYDKLVIGALQETDTCTYHSRFELGADGWTAGFDTCTTGALVVGAPDATAWQVDGGNPGQALFTAANTGGLGVDDVDGGTCEALSPVVDCQSLEAVEIGLDYFHGQRDSGDDFDDGFVVEVLNNGLVAATLVDHGDVTSQPVWNRVSTVITDPGNLQIRVRISDGPSNGDIVEGGIDNVSISPSPPPATGATTSSHPTSN